MLINLIKLIILAKINIKYDNASFFSINPNFVNKMPVLLKTIPLKQAF